MTYPPLMKKLFIGGVKESGFSGIIVLLFFHKL